MKITLPAVLLWLTTLAFAGCASSSPNIIPDNAPSFVVNQPLDKTRSAAKNVLTNCGFNVNELSDTFLEGYRPYQFDMLASNGGEKVRIWLQSIEVQKTRITIK